MYTESVNDGLIKWEMDGQSIHIILICIFPKLAVKEPKSKFLP